MATSDDLVKRLGQVFKIKGEIDNLMKIPKAAEISFKTQAGQLQATNDDLNKLRFVGRKWNNQLDKLYRHDENWWVDWSGSNAFSVSASKKAIIKVTTFQNKLRAFKSASSGLATLTYTILVADNADIKGLAKVYVPSLIAIDAMVAKEAVTAFNACSVHSDKLLKKLNRILPSLRGTVRLASGIHGKSAR